MHESLQEIEQYCEDNGWLIEIYQFCSQWSDKTVVEYRNVPAFNIEVSHTTDVRYTGISNTMASLLSKGLDPQLTIVLPLLAVFFEMASKAASTQNMKSAITPELMAVSINQSINQSNKGISARSRPLQ
jgi:hypothetical protein